MLRQPAQRRDGRRAGIAGGGRDDGGAAAALGQRAGEQPAQQLQRDILEGERRAVKQLEQIEPAADLDQRRDGRRVESGIGGVDIGAQFGIGESVADEAASGCAKATSA